MNKLRSGLVHVDPIPDFPTKSKKRCRVSRKWCWSEEIAPMRLLSKTMIMPRTRWTTASIKICGFIMNEPSPQNAIIVRGASAAAAANSELAAKPM